jgi:hypothetical protein
MEVHRGRRQIRMTKQFHHLPHIAADVQSRTREKVPHLMRMHVLRDPGRSSNFRQPQLKRPRIQPPPVRPREQEAVFPAADPLTQHPHELPADRDVAVLVPLAASDFQAGAIEVDVGNFEVAELGHAPAGQEARLNHHKIPPGRVELLRRRGCGQVGGCSRCGEERVDLGVGQDLRQVPPLLFLYSSFSHRVSGPRAAFKSGLVLGLPFRFLAFGRFHDPPLCLLPMVQPAAL